MKKNIEKRRMTYVYPKFDGRDFIFFRLGGCGLGNLLLIYARAIVYAEKYSYNLIWPSWVGIMPKIIFSSNKDKRLYFNIFKNNYNYISGIKKIMVLLLKKRLNESNDCLKNELNDKIIVVKGLGDGFEQIKYDYKFVKNNIINILNKNQKGVLSYKFCKHIAVHVRLGDFKKSNVKELLNGGRNVSIPIEWYVKIINDIRRIVGENIPVLIYSDGSDSELKPLTNLENAKRITFKSSIGDIIGISNSTIFISSRSSFSNWGRYLGRMSTVIFPDNNQEFILTPEEEGVEIEAYDEIPKLYHEHIKKLFK
ncbi:alpha-1,2-fucosyltransferase [Clostridium perfringens]